MDQYLKDIRGQMREAIEEYYESTNDIGLGNIDEDAVFDSVVREWKTTEWKKRAAKKMMEGDREGMVKEIEAIVQHDLVEVAMTADDEKVRVDALKFLMGQGGNGVVQQHAHKIEEYKRWPEDQLMTFIGSKIGEIKRLNPGFDMSRILLTTGEDVTDQEEQTVTTP